MESSDGYLHGLVILSFFFALSLGAAVAANAPVVVGTDITKIIGVNYLGVDQWAEIANEGTGSIVKVHAGKGNNPVKLGQVSLSI
jgi:hypothetical protein